MTEPTEPTDAAVLSPDGAAVRRSPLPSGRAVLAWAAFTGAAIALDGWAGAVAGVLVAAVVLAGLRPVLLGALGVAALVAVPVAVVVDGIPTEGEVAPSFVSRSLWPHHLTFVGLVLVAAWVVLDVVAHRHAALDEGHELAASAAEVAPPFPSLGARARVAVVAVVGLGAVVASVAVLFP